MAGLTRLTIQGLITQLERRQFQKKEETYRFFMHDESNC